MVLTHSYSLTHLLTHSLTYSLTHSGILQSIARIEKQGYDALTRLGASPVTEVYSSGGGSKNEMWTRMRQRILGVPTKVSTNVEAAYGSALLAKKYL
jgi:sugar (pentulose or hexulose) kinase